jgi:hypothetical protein
VEDLEMQGRALICCAQTHMRLRQSRSCLTNYASCLLLHTYMHLLHTHTHIRA